MSYFLKKQIRPTTSVLHVLSSPLPQSLLRALILSSFIALFLGSFAAHATVGSYDYWWPRNLEEYFQQIESTKSGDLEVAQSPLNSSATAKNRSAQCPQRVQFLKNKEVLDIRYALGYFDESFGREAADAKWGYSYSLDQIAFETLKDFLLKPCSFNSVRQLCGFSKESSQDGIVVLRKEVQNGPDLRVTLTGSSASPLFLANTGELKLLQKQISAQSEANFLDGIRSADIVFYNGHSRDGGGPDFDPPVLRPSDLKPNYSGHYQARRPGQKKMLAALKQRSQSSPAVLGLFSCYSERHFVKSVKATSPQLSLITSVRAVDYLNTILASMGYLEGLLQAKCGDDLDQMAKQNPYISIGFIQHNL